MADIVQNINDKNLRREVRRNTSNQIISYTLPPSSVEQYGLVKLPAVKEEFNREQFERTITTNNSEFFVTVPDTNISVISKNDRIAIPTIIDTKYKWNGELVRIGDFPGGSTYYYIEDGIYHKLTGNGTFNFIAEKLNKPLGFRVDNSYDYNTNQLDYGQNQFAIYDKQTYIRKSEAYLKSFEEGDDVTPEDIMINGVTTRQIQIFNNGDGTDEFGIYTSLEVGGIASTRANWNLNKTVKKRDILASIGEDLEIRFLYANGTDENIAENGFDIDLSYDGGSNLVKFNVKGSEASDEEFTAAASGNFGIGVALILATTPRVTTSPSGASVPFAKYVIPGTYITDKLDKITISVYDQNQAEQFPTIVGTPVGNI